MISFDPGIFFLTVDDYNMHERLDSSWHLVYYQVSGSQGVLPGVIGHSLQGCGLACKLIH